MVTSLTRFASSVLTRPQANPLEFFPINLPRPDWYYCLSGYNNPTLEDSRGLTYTKTTGNYISDSLGTRSVLSNDTIAFRSDRNQLKSVIDELLSENGFYYVFFYLDFIFSGMTTNGYVVRALADSNEDARQSYFFDFRTHAVLGLISEGILLRTEQAKSDSTLAAERIYNRYDTNMVNDFNSIYDTDGFIFNYDFSSQTSLLSCKVSNARLGYDYPDSTLNLFDSQNQPIGSQFLPVTHHGKSPFNQSTVANGYLYIRLTPGMVFRRFGIYGYKTEITKRPRFA